MQSINCNVISFQVLLTRIIWLLSTNSIIFYSINKMPTLITFHHLSNLFFILIRLRLVRGLPSNTYPKVYSYSLTFRNILPDKLIQILPCLVNSNRVKSANPGQGSWNSEILNLWVYGFYLSVWVPKRHCKTRHEQSESHWKDECGARSSWNKPVEMIASNIQCQLLGQKISCSVCQTWDDRSPARTVYRWWKL